MPHFLVSNRQKPVHAIPCISCIKIELRITFPPMEHRHLNNYLLSTCSGSITAYDHWCQPLTQVSPLRMKQAQLLLQCTKACEQCSILRDGKDDIRHSSINLPELGHSRLSTTQTTQRTCPSTRLQHETLQSSHISRLADLFSGVFELPAQLFLSVKRNTS